MCPYFFAAGNTLISSYSLMIMLGILLGCAAAIYLAKKDNLNVNEVVTYLFLLCVVAILGGRIYFLLYYFIKEPSAFFQKPIKVFEVLSSGGVFYGGVIFGVLFSLVYLKKRDISFWRMADITGVGLALGHSIGRIGCFLSGCCYGRPTDFPLAVRFPHLPVRVHPTQLYESVLNFLNFLFLMAVFRNRKFRGQVFSLYLINYAVIRFFLEYLRGDPGRGYILRSDAPLLSLSIPQLISVLAFISGIVIIRIRSKQKR
jgi:phosphatidylglycerol:prolipoprotein diacylglycerol transferase